MEDAGWRRNVTLERTSRGELEREKKERERGIVFLLWYIQGGASEKRWAKTGIALFFYLSISLYLYILYDYISKGWAQCARHPAIDSVVPHFLAVFPLLLFCLCLCCRSPIFSWRRKEKQREKKREREGSKKHSLVPKTVRTIRETHTYIGLIGGGPTTDNPEETRSITTTARFLPQWFFLPFDREKRGRHAQTYTYKKKSSVGHTTRAIYVSLFCASLCVLREWGCLRMTDCFLPLIFFGLDKHLLQEIFSPLTVPGSRPLLFVSTERCETDRA